MIYFDNAATSFPKPNTVSNNMKYFIDNIGINVKRGTSNKAFDAGDKVFETRELICKLFNYDNADNVVFTMNITQSLNFLIRGLLKPDDHVIITSLEHNAVVRTLNEININYTIIKGNKYGIINPNDFIGEIKPNTKAIIMTHASNVSGTITPINEVGQICKEHNIYFIIDSAQTAGLIDIDFYQVCASAIAFTGHKGLLGPQGIGGFIINNKLVEELNPLICGGTGSDSVQEVQPNYMPDKFEAGTMNVPGIYGLHASLTYILNHGINNILHKELELTKIFIDNLKDISEIEIIGLKETKNRTAVISINFLTLDNGEVNYILENEYNIITRCGLHCAPSAHKTHNSYPEGTVRFSFSHYNTKKEINYAVDCIKKIIEVNNEI